MAQITPSVGLVSGLNTSLIINALLELDQEPVTILQTEINTDNAQQQVYSQFETQLQSLQTISQTLGQTTTFQAATTSSSNPNVLTATANNGAALGSFQFQVARLVSSQQSISQGFTDPASASVGTGTITLSLGGGGVTDSTALTTLNGGAGIQSGEFKITDASGNTATIDTTNDISLDDIVNQINTSTSIDVKASVGPNGLVLQDLTGGSGTLKVQDLGSGQTAASLGITNSAVAGVITGSNINTISRNTALSQINDGNGIQVAGNGQADFQITDAAGATFSINLAAAKTIGAALDTINTATGGAVTASLSASGQGITLTDTSTGSGNLTVTDLNSTAAQGLGIAGTGTGGTIAGKQLIASLDSVLVSSLNGGKGLTLGSINLTDRNGNPKSINLSGAQSVSDIVSDINTQGAGSVKASINAAGDGIQIQDVSGGTGNLVISDGDSNDTATALGIAGTFSSGTTTVQGADLHRQYVSQNTLLANYNGGKGVTLGTFDITNSAGVTTSVDLSTSSAVTLGDIINDINARNAGVTASINSTGDGLLLTDTAGGTGTMSVKDETGTTASDLNIAGTATGTTLNGSFTKSITVGVNDTLNTVVSKINALGLGVTANIVNDGSSSAPYRLSLTANNTGADGQFIFDAGTTNLQTSNLVQAQDAAVFVGGQGSAQPLLITSSQNQLNDVINGVTINLLGTSSQPVTLNVSQDTSGVATQLQNFTDGFNTLINQINSLTAYDSVNNQGGLLLGDATTQDIQERLYDGITNTVLSSGNYRTLADIGLTVGNNGQLTFDSSTFEAAIAADPTDVENLFTQATNGASVNINNDINQLIDPAHGVITLQDQSISTKTQQFNDRINELNQMIDEKRNLLETQFADMETTLSTLQSQQAVISNLSGSSVKPSTSSSSSSSSSSSG